MQNEKQTATLHRIAEEYGINIRLYDIIPNKPLVVLVHGIGVSGEYFAPLAKSMGGHYSILTLDLPGYGDTPKPRKIYTPEELGDILGRFLIKAELQGNILIGHSMGSQIATRTATLHPSVCSKLIIIGPTVNNKERSVFKQGIRLLQDSFHETLESNLVIFRNYLKMGLIPYLKTARYMVDDHLEKYLTQVTQPTLIVRGDLDKIAPLDWLKLLSTHATNSSIVEIASAPHAVHYIKPDELFKECQKFIDA